MEDKDAHDSFTIIEPIQSHMSESMSNLETGLKRTFHDELDFGGNKAVLDQIEFIKGEKVIFSCIVSKYNRFCMK